MGGPLSIGFPEPLKMRPSMSCDTGVFNTCENNKREKRDSTVEIIHSKSMNQNEKEFNNGYLRINW